MRAGLVLVSSASLIVVAACGDNELPQGEVRGGARLRVVSWIDDDGDRLVRGWFDRELGVECAWTAGDTPRCLPPLQLSSQFADPLCTEPLLARDPDPGPCAPPVPDLVGVRRDACADGAVDEVWSVAGTFAPAWVYDHDPRTGGCVGRPAPTSFAYYRAGERLPLERFVGGTLVDLGRGRIATRTIVGDDGSLAPLAGFDRDLGAVCDPALERGCWPRTSWAGYAEDDVCSAPVIGAPVGCEPPPVIGMYQTDPASLFRTGEVITSDPEQPLVLYNMSFLIAGQGWACARADLRVVPGYALYRAGAAIPTTTLAPAAEAVGDGVRLRATYLASGGHRQLVGYDDLALHVPCSPTEVSAGVWRCLPALGDVWRRFFYADDACTQPLALVFGAPDDPLPAGEWVDDGACGRALHVWGRGAPRGAGTYFWRDDGGRCLPWDGHGEDSPDAYELGAEVTLDLFPSLASIVE